MSLLHRVDGNFPQPPLNLFQSLKDTFPCTLQINLGSIPELQNPIQEAFWKSLRFAIHFSSLERDCMIGCSICTIQSINRCFLHTLLQKKKNRSLKLTSHFLLPSLNVLIASRTDLCSKIEDQNCCLSHTCAFFCHCLNSKAAISRHEKMSHHHPTN